MPRFIDSHPMGKLTPEQLILLQKAAKDSYGVTHHELLYNEKDNRLFCILDAPNEEAVRKHHDHAGIDISWIEEVRSTQK
jgi:hypothetical protein